MAATVARLSAWMRSRREGDGRGAMPLGIHFEGPFVSAARCGALHPSCFLDGSDPRTLDAFFEALGDPPGRPMTTLAPEIPGGIAVVRAFKKRGFLVSIGHTEASASTLDEALEAGASHMTHFGNAMKPLHHRDVGPIGWGLATDGVTVDVVADLHHLAPEMLRLVLKVKGESRVALISDAMPAAGLGDGAYAVWGETLTVEGRRRAQRRGRARGLDLPPRRVRGAPRVHRRPERCRAAHGGRRPGAPSRPRLTQIFQNQPRFSKTRSTAHQKTIVTSAKACERSVGSEIQEKPPR